MNRSKINIYKTLIVLVIMTFLHTVFILSELSAFDDLCVDINPIALLSIPLIVPGVLMCMNACLYKSYRELLLHVPVYYALCVIFGILPEAFRSPFCNFMHEIFPFSAVNAMFVALIRSLLWMIAMLVIFTAVKVCRRASEERKNNGLCSKSETSGKMNCLENKKSAKVNKIVLSAFDSVLAGIPLLEIFSLSSMTMIEHTANGVPESTGGAELGIFLIVAFLAYFIIPLIRIVFNLIVHKDIQSWLKYSSPFQIITAVMIMLFNKPLLLYAPPIISEIHVSKLNESVAGFIQAGEDVIYALIYVLQWFIVISLVFAVKAFIRYCNRQFIKESLERKENL